MRGALFGGVVGCVLGAAMLWAAVGSSTPSRSQEEIEELHALRRDVARLSATVAAREGRTQGVGAAELEMAMHRAVAEGRTSARHDTGAGAADDVASSNDEAAPSTGNEAAFHAALSVIDQAEATGGTWSSEDVQQLRAYLHGLSVEEHVAVTNQLVLALNEGRLRMGEGVFHAF